MNDKAAVDDYGVVLGGHTVEYRDGAEDRVLDVLMAAVDRSDGSDELAHAIVDWPTQYHFSPMRSNLLAPLDITPGTTVLEIGAGSGILTRALVERGAVVTAVEGSLARARVAATRCRGLDNVTVIAGTTQDVPPDRHFDIVLVIGVLEHTAGNDERGPDEFLADCASHVGPSGVLILAIENQLGVKYLLGYDEDHQSVPWVGVEGYPRNGARTWSRRALSTLIDDHGLPAQTWMYPFPDYKHPRIVLTDRLYERADAADLVDLFVRQPATEDAGRAAFVCDVRSAHRVMVDAGLGADVANSFLVIAGRDTAAIEGRTDGSLGWYYGSPRLRPWRRTWSITDAADGALELTSRIPIEASSRAGWLSQASIGARPVHIGRSLDRLLADALDHNDMSQAEQLVKHWVACLPALEREPPGVRHPFSPRPGDRSLPADHLDIDLSNFVLDGDGLHYIDAEWCASGPVSMELAIIRSLWNFSVEYVSVTINSPWGPTVSVDRVSARLAHTVGLEVDDATLLVLRQAEAVLQEIVGGHPADGTRDQLCELGRRRPIDTLARNTPVGSLTVRLRQAQADTQALTAELSRTQELYAVALDEVRLLTLELEESRTV